jgi:hypothetical protein
MSASSRDSRELGLIRGVCCVAMLLQALQRASGRRHLADADLQRTTEVSLTALLDNCGFHHPVGHPCQSSVLSKGSISGLYVHCVLRLPELRADQAAHWQGLHCTVGCTDVAFTYACA